MKKLKFLLVTLMLGLLMTGCGINEGKDSLEDAINKMNDLDNYEMTMTMDIGVKSSGIEITMPITIKSLVDVKNFSIKTETTASMFGMSFSTVTYEREEDGKTVTYTEDGENDSWVKTISNNKMEIDDADILDNYENVKVVDSDIDGMKKYEVSASKEAIQDLLNDSMDDSEDSEYTVKDNVKIDVYVNNKTGYVGKIVMNLKDFVEYNVDDAEVTKMTIDISYDKCNEVGNVIIPSQIVENATLIDE